MSVLYSILSHSWSGLIVAALVAGVAGIVVRLALRSRHPATRYVGFALYGIALLLAVGSAVAIVRAARVADRFRPPGKLVDVNGYRMQILAEGDAHGGPTLLWIPGGHAPGLAFYGHHRTFRSETRSILYDRAGSGWSDTGPFPRRTALEAQELTTLLDRAGERGPFVVIGHSYGGLLAANFARRHPEKVAALVLLDALQPDMLAYNRYVDGDGFGTMMRMEREQGILKLFGIRHDPLGKLASQDPQIAEIQRAQERYMADQGAALDALDDLPASNWATISLNGEFEPQALQREAPQWLVYDGELGDLPVYIVLPRGQIDALIASAGNDRDKVRALRIFQRMQLRYMQTSSRTKLVYAPAGTSHNFPYEKPEFVTNLVRDVLRQSAVGAEPSTLFSDVNVVTMVDDRVLPHQDVLVRDGRIARIANHGSIKDPQAALVVKGEGRYLMPGLTEMHGHLPGPDREQYGYDILTLFLAHGFTTVRSMLGNPWHIELRTRSERNELLAPRLYIAGPSLNGQSAPEIAKAISMVREQAAAGYDFLKLHPGLKLEVFDAIAHTAKEQHITFQGHISEDVGVVHALETGQRAIDHMDGYLEALADPICRKGLQSGFFGLGVLECVDESRIPDLVRRTKQAGTWIVPTENLIEQWANPPTAGQLRARPATRFMPPAVVSQWIETYRGSTDGEKLTPERLRRFVKVRRALMREMYHQQVPIALGSDAPQIFNVPGDSALEELRLYAEIGLTPYDALRTATAAPAEFFHATDQFGAVREGLSADLLLLDRNPLQDVRAVRALDGVMLRGRWLPRTELDSLLAQVAAHAAGSAH